MNRTTRIITPAAATALTTLAAVKDALAIADTSSDTFLTRQIAVASGTIAEYCGRVFGRHTVEDTFRTAARTCGRDVLPLVLSRNLFDASTAGASVTVNGMGLDPSAYSLDTDAGLLWRLAPSGALLQWTGGPVVVQFVAGWVLPEQSGPTLPAVVEDVCLDLASAAYYSRGRDSSVSRERVEGVGDIYYFATTPNGSPDPRLEPFRLRDL